MQDGGWSQGKARRRVVKQRVMVVGGACAVGHALEDVLTERGFEVDMIRDEDVWKIGGRRWEGVAALILDTSVWWGSGDVCREGMGEYRQWLERALEEGVRQVLVVSSAATLGRECDEYGLYRMGEGQAWEDCVWQFEAQAYHYMSQGLGVWFALPTMVVGEGRNALYESWLKGGAVGGGDVVAADDVARGCVLVLGRGRPGRRYVLGGEWIEGGKGRGETSYLGGRKYELEIAQGEIGYGIREDIKGRVLDEMRQI